jgi:hypothetical protein
LLRFLTGKSLDEKGIGDRVETTKGGLGWNGRKDM